MNIFSNFIEKERWERALQDLKDVDFSFFYDYVPSQVEAELSNINIFVACEPNEYFGHHDFAINNHESLSLILTWSDKVLNNTPNSVFSFYGESWWQDNPFQFFPAEKEFKISFLRGNKLKLYGHYLRHELYDRRNEFKVPIQFWESLGDPNNWEDWRQSKIDSFRPYQYSICVENTSRRGYFTEKITDCILNKTIPIYWGCSNIEEFYNPDGILRVQNVDDIIHFANTLTPEIYESRLKAVEENYLLALEYKDYAGNVAKQLKELFKENNLI